MSGRALTCLHSPFFSRCALSSSHKPILCRFHVDDLSSAHVYLRLPPDGSIESIPADVLEDCAQLVKANSIQGNKLNNITVVYTPWANLKKTQSMDVGQVRLPPLDVGCMYDHGVDAVIFSLHALQI